jgi:hypothetical protein
MRQGRGEAGSSSAGESMNGSNERNPRLQSGRINTEMLVRACFAIEKVKLEVLAGNQPKKAEAATKKAAAAKA